MNWLMYLNSPKEKTFYILQNNTYGKRNQQRQFTITNSKSDKGFQKNNIKRNTYWKTNFPK